MPAPKRTPNEPVMRGAAACRIDIHSGPESLPELRSEWERLWKLCPDATEAQTWVWQSLYWAHVARGRQCLVATARGQDGELLAVAAFEVRRDRRSFLKVLSFSGEHDADYHGILRVAGLAPAVGAQMLAAVVRAAGSAVSFIEWSNMPCDSWTAAAVRLALPAFGSFAGTAVRHESETYAILLPASMDEYWATFSKKTRDRLKGKMRKFQRELPTEFRVATDAQNVAAVLDNLEAVDRSRWGGATKFADPAQRAFLREMIAKSLEAGLARVFTLHAEGRCVAFNVGFVLGDAIRMPYLAHDASMPGSYSVGLINNLLAIEHCLQSGLKEFDLTRGSEGYKSLLGGEARHNVHFVMWRTDLHRMWGDFNRRCISPLLRNRMARRLYRCLRR